MDMQRITQVLLENRRIQKEQLEIQKKQLAATERVVSLLEGNCGYDGMSFRVEVINPSP